MNITELKALADDLVPLWDNGSFEREDAEQARDAINELIAQLEEARAQMERQKDEWLSWEAKRRDLEKAAAQLEDAQGEIRALRATEAGLLERVKELEEGLRALYKGYVNLLDGGKMRIESLGGTCDPVDRMEADSPYLRAARALLEKQQ